VGRGRDLLTVLFALAAAPVDPARRLVKFGAQLDF